MAKKGHIPWNKGKTGIYSEKTRKKISELNKGRPSPNKGKKLSEETKDKISKSNKGKLAWNKGKTGIYSEEVKRKISESHKGQIPWNKGKKGVYSEKTKMKMSKSHKNMTDDTKRKISKSNKGKLAWNKGKTGIYSEKTRKKISESLTGKKLSEKTKNKISKGNKGKNTGKKHSEETKNKISEQRSKQVFPFRDTIPEKMMETALRLENIEFKKHRAFKIGNSHHQVDFFIEPNICIEVDGIYFHNTPYQIERDNKIDINLKSQGFQVIRIIAPKVNKDFDVKFHAEKIKNILDRMKN